ncbi:MAG: hypothetical protein WCL22_05770, partial [bacterium]
MSTLTPENIVDNLYKKFPQIIGNAIVGYYKFFKLEEELISMVDDTIEPKIINSFIIYNEHGNNMYLGNILGVKEWLLNGKHQSGRTIKYIADSVAKEKSDIIKGYLKFGAWAES